jgi:hypothetical protein
MTNSDNAITPVMVQRCRLNVRAHESQNLRFVQKRQRNRRILAPHSAQKFGRCNVRNGMCVRFRSARIIGRSNRITELQDHTIEHYRWLNPLPSFLGLLIL